MGNCLIMTIKIHGDNHNTAAGTSGSDNDTGVVYGNNEIKLVTDGTDRLVADSSGKVGIGTSSPTSKLEVISTTAGDPALRVEGSCTALSDVVLNNWQPTGGAVSANLQYHDSPTQSDNIATNRISLGTSTLNTFTLKTSDIDRLTITNQGYAGLNTDTPYLWLAKSFVMMQKGTNDGITIAAPSTSSNSWLAFSDSTDGNARWQGAVRYRHSTDQLRFYVGGEHEITIPNGGGIAFGGDYAAADTLNDYEEGTWTPTVTGGSMNNSSSYGKYIKIGNKVHLYFHLKISSIDNSTGTVSFGGVPFTPAAGGYTGSCMTNLVGFNSSANTTVVPYMSNGTGGVRFYGFRHNAGWQALRRVDWNANDSCYGQISYCHL